MRSRSLVWLAVFCLIVSVAIPVIAQERKKKTTVTDFPTIVDEAKRAFGEKRYGNCVGLLRDAITVCSSEIRKLVLESMPPAPDGFEKEAPQDEATNALVGAMTAGVGQSIQQEYRSKDGSGSISINVMPDSPMAASMAMLIKMSAVDPGAEIVKYGTDTAIFKKEGGDSFAIQILMSDKHVIDGRSLGLDEDRFFKKIFTQELVDKVRAAVAGN